MTNVKVKLKEKERESRRERDREGARERAREPNLFPNPIWFSHWFLGRRAPVIFFYFPMFKVCRQLKGYKGTFLVYFCDFWYNSVLSSFSAVHSSLVNVVRTSGVSVPAWTGTPRAPSFDYQPRSAVSRALSWRYTAFKDVKIEVISRCFFKFC